MYLILLFHSGHCILNIYLIHLLISTFIDIMDNAILYIYLIILYVTAVFFFTFIVVLYNDCTGP